MLQWMLRVDSWLDVASLENVEEDHSFLFLKWNLIKIFFFFFDLENLNFSKELKIENFFFSKILEILNVFKELKILIDDFFFFFFFEKFRSLEFFQGIEKIWLMIFFWKIWKSWIFSRNWKFWLMIFFFWKQPKKYEPNASSPKALFENFLLLFYFFKKKKNLSFEWE